MRIRRKDIKEINLMRDAGRLVAETFAFLAPHIQPGATLRDLDHLAETFIHSRGASSLYKGYRGSSRRHPPFPGVICASVNQ